MSNPFAGRILVIVVSVSMFALSVLGQAKADPTAQDLVLGKAIEKQLGGSELHRYKVTLQKDQSVNITVTSKSSLRLGIQITDPNGKAVGTVKKLNDDEQVIELTAVTSGNFLVTVKNTDTKTSKASYTIRRNDGSKSVERETTPAKSVVNISGAWRLLISGPQGTLDVSFDIKQTGEDWTGVGQLPIGEIKVSGTALDENRFSASAVLDMKGTPLTGKLEGSIEGNKMKGTIKPDMQGLPQLQFVGERRTGQ